MPIYEYQASSERQCDYCAKGFESLRRSSDPELTQCPRCHAPVRRKLSAPHLANSSTSLAPSNLEKHGFTQYRKSGKGVYEKTAGKGPDVISDD
jgi:putative FmdB family regulatory protein